MLTPTKLTQLLYCFLFLFSGISQASILSFGSISQTGQSINVDVVISDLGISDAPSLSTYDLDIQFDFNHLAYSSTTFGDSILGNQLDLSDFGENLTDESLTSAGVLNIYEASFDLTEDLNDLQADSFTLATLTFDVLTNNSSQLSIVINALGDAAGESISADLSSATITTVPVPAAFWLMASGLAVLYKKRKLV